MNGLVALLLLTFALAAQAEISYRTESDIAYYPEDIRADREKEMLGRYEENAYLMRMMKVAGHKDTNLIELKGLGHGITNAAIPLVLKEIERIEALAKP